MTKISTSIFIKKLFRRLLVSTLVAFCVSNAEAAKLKSIGVSISDLGNPFFVRMSQAVETKAKELAGNDVKITVVSSAYDLRRQIGQVDDFIAKRVDLIILTAADPLKIEPAIHRAQSAGIKVIAVDVNAKGADATITSDNAQAGSVACEYLAKRMNGKGNLVIINGPPVSAVLDRVQGCRAAIEQFPGIKLLSDKQNGGGNHEGGLEKMTDLLIAFPQIDAVFAINDPTAIGAELAARQARKDHFIIGAVDGAPAIEERLRDKSSLIEGSSAQFPDRMAIKAVEIGMQLLEGRQPKKNTIHIPTMLITKENVATYSGWEK